MSPPLKPSRFCSNEVKRLLSSVLLIVCIICIIPCAVPLIAEGKGVQAVVDRTQTDLEIPIRLSVTIPSDKGRVDTATIQDFKVIAHGTSSSVQIINGQMTREKTFNYTLIPLRSGRLKIPALTVYAGDKTAHTDSIEIIVSKTPAKETGAKDLFVTATLSDPNPYIGQQVFYTFELHYGAQIANTDYEPPSFNGFTAKQIEEQKTAQKVINGRRYQVVTLSYILIPLKSGDLVIPPAVLRCDKVLRSSNRSRNRFDTFFGQNRLEPRILRTKAIPVTVTALPPYTGKDSFSGLVGQFEMHADLETFEATVGESVTLSITIQGQGNIQDAEAPTLAVPTTFKEYKDQPESDVTLGPQGYQGEKVFRTALVPVASGRHTVGVAPLIFFDPIKKHYRTLMTQPLALSVQDAVQSADAPTVLSAIPENGTAPNLFKKQVEFKSRDILPLKAELDALKASSKLSMAFFLSGLTLPAVLFFLGMGILNLFKKNDMPAAVMAQKSKQELHAAKNSDIEDGNDYLSNLYRALVYASFSKAGTIGESLAPSEFESLLKSHGVSHKTTARAAALLSQIEQTRFGAGTMTGSAKNEMIEQTQRLVKSLI
jgi:oxygen tolerance protein BatD